MPSEYTDLYKILGVPSTASQAEIKTAFRLKARENHPDLNSDRKAEATRRMQDVNYAYEILGNVKKRRRYDESLKAYTGKAGPPQTPPKPTESYNPPRTKQEERPKYPFPPVSEMLSRYNLESHFKEFLSTESANHNAAEEVIPILNIALAAASEWLISQSYTFSSNSEEMEIAREDLTRFLESLINSNYTNGEATRITLAYKSSRVAAQLIAACCEYCSKTNCEIKVNHSESSFIITFSKHKLADDAEPVSPLDSQFNTYISALKQKAPNIYQIITAKTSLVEGTKFLRSTTSTFYTRLGLVDAYKIWYSAKQAPELEEGLDQQIYRLVQVCLEYPTREYVYSDMDIDNFVNKKFRQLPCDEWKCPNVKLIKDAVIHFLIQEFNSSRTILNSSLTLAELIVELGKLSNLGQPLRIIHIRSLLFNFKPEAFRMSSWAEVLQMFVELSSLTNESNHKPMADVVRESRKLPDYLNLQMLYLYYYLLFTNQSREYYAYFSKPKPVFRKSQTALKWESFEKALDANGPEYRDNFREFFKLKAFRG